MPERKRKRGGQPGNQNAIKHGRYSVERQRLSDEWIKTVPKTDYAAIALAGKLARQR